MPPTALSRACFSWACVLSHCIVVTPIVAMVAEHSMKEQVILHLLDCAELGGIWDEDLCHLSSKKFLQNLVAPFFCGADLCEPSVHVVHRRGYRPINWWHHWGQRQEENRLLWRACFMWSKQSRDSVLQTWYNTSTYPISMPTWWFSIACSTSRSVSRWTSGHVGFWRG